MGSIAFALGFVMMSVSLVAFCSELRLLDKYAKANGLSGISKNMFKSTFDFLRLRNTVPVSTRNRIQRLEFVSLFSWFTAVILLNFHKKI